MKVTIDEVVCSNYDIAIEEVLIALLIRLKVDINNVLNSLIEEKEIYTLPNGNFKLDKDFDSKITQVLLSSDTTIPNSERCENLAIQMRALYPKGNSSSGYPWRGNLKDLTKRLQKFFKIYGNQTDEAILEATKKYVVHYNGNYTYMRTLKYFILKSEDGDNNSDLATWLENSEDIDDNNTDWTTSLV